MGESRYVTLMSLCGWPSRSCQGRNARFGAFLVSNDLKEHWLTLEFVGGMAVTWWMSLQRFQPPPQGRTGAQSCHGPGPAWCVFAATERAPPWTSSPTDDTAAIGVSGKTCRSEFWSSWVLCSWGGGVIISDGQNYASRTICCIFQTPLDGVFY